jgi:hypothetical protein
MIFGFNTDVKQGGTVYHVQSEARTQDLLLQTQVFVKGRCIGKRASSYAARSLEPDFSDERMHEMLKAQHKAMVEAVRAGNLDAVTGMDADICDVEGQGLAVRWINSEEPLAGSTMKMRFVVTDTGAAAVGAELTSRLASSTSGGPAAFAVADASGQAEMEIEFDGVAEPAVLVRAVHGEKSATRKFRVRHP